jgi:hypothetical protein
MDNRQKEVIEKARKDETIMEICHHEYLAEYGKQPPKNWEPSDKEILEVASKAGFNIEEDNTEIKPMPTVILGGKFKNKFMLVDMNKEEVILEFNETDEDAAIAHVFSIYKPPLENCNLYQMEVDNDENYNFKENAKIIDLPIEITEDGDYIF